MKLNNNKFLLAVLTSSFVGMVVLSWWLLFRDERALNGFQLVYPFLGNSLYTLRQVLLNYSLNVIPTLLFAILAITSFGSYFLLLKKKTSVKKIIKLAIIFQVIVFFSYPILSTDIFSYMFTSRVSTHYGQNRWLVTPDNFSNDNFEKFSDWKNKTNVYGYVNHLIYLPADYLGQDDVFSTAMLYKLTVAIFAIASIFVFLKLLEKKSELEKSYYLKLIFWNPLFLLEILGSGHNDIFLLFFVLLSILFWQKKNWIISGLVIALCVQVKLIAIIFFSFFALNLLKNKKIYAFLKYSISFLLINIFSFALMKVSPITFVQSVFSNTEIYWQSLPGLVSKFLPELTIPFTLLFGLLGLLFVFLQLKKGWNPIYTSTLTIFLYLVFFSGLYWNWYVLWIFVFVPFIKDKLLQNTILLLTFTSLMAYPILWFSHRFAFGNSIWDIFAYIWIFGVPITFLVYNRYIVKLLIKQKG